MVKGYVLALLDCLSHADANVREGASEALGVLMKILGEPLLTKMMPDLEAIKLTKIKEYCEKTVLTGKMPKITNDGPKPGSKPKATTAGSTAPKKVVRPAKKPSVPAKKVVEVPDEDDFGMDDDPPPPPRKTSSAPARRGAPAGRGRGGAAAARPSTTASAAQRKKSEDIDPNPPYDKSSKKNQRFKDEQKLKVLKWHFAAPRAEFIDQLRDQTQFLLSLKFPMFKQ